MAQYEPQSTPRHGYVIAVAAAPHLLISGGVTAVAVAVGASALLAAGLAAVVLGATSWRDLRGSDR